MWRGGFLVACRFVGGVEKKTNKVHYFHTTDNIQMMLNKPMFALRRIATSKSASMCLVRASFSTTSGEKFTERMQKTGELSELS